MRVGFGNRHACARRSRSGVSLVEILVVIGLIGLLVAILLPVLSMARTSARKVVCAGRVRELSLAARMYCDANGVYPLPLGQVEVDTAGQIVVAHKPHQISNELLNDIRPYLKFPEVAPATTVTELPPFVQCPFAEELLVDRGPNVSMFDPDLVTYYTGYAYLARLAEAPTVPKQKGPALLAASAAAAAPPAVDRGRVLKPNRSATAKDKRRAVLWADHVYRSEVGVAHWQYTHARGGKPGPLPLTYSDHAGLVGQHRGYTDGSVEWVDTGQEGLEVEKPEPDKTAAFKRAQEHWWF